MRLEIYSNRWAHIDPYEVSVTDRGWEIKHLSIGGRCDRQGNPYLFQNLEQDLVSYPQNLGMCMEHLWRKIRERRMSERQIQSNLNKISKWIYQTEINTPKTGIFTDF